MKRQFRIAAGGIVIDDSKILLVRYNDNEGGSYLVSPGGGVIIDESLESCVAREIYEETGLHVNVEKMLHIEDLLSKKYRMVKIWFLCQRKSGHLTKTHEAKIEGITEVGWFSKEQLTGETVFPSFINSMDWTSFTSLGWSSSYATLAKANF